MAKKYRAYASNESGAGTSVADRKEFRSIKAAETASRNEFGSGWMIKIVELETIPTTYGNDYVSGENVVKSFRIR